MNQNLALTAVAQQLGTANRGLKARKIAAVQFNNALNAARRARFWGRLVGRSSRLKSLKHTASQRASKSNRTGSIPLDLIIGSEGRSDDFDARFRPLKSHNQDRWIGIAAARLMGVALPPIELVQDGNNYYVRDGNHRVSVATAMGQLEIEARIVN